MVFLTHKERTVRKYSWDSVMAAVYARLARYPDLGVCMDRAPRTRNRDTRFTLEELNEFADRIVDDSLYYGVHTRRQRTRLY